MYAKFPNLASLAYETSCFGMVYFLSDEDIAHYSQEPDNYGTFQILQDHLDDFGETRADEILAGSPFTQTEKNVLKQIIADEDIEGWIGIHGWEADTTDSTVFVVAFGYSEGQGGIRLADPEVYRTKKDAQDRLERKKIWFVSQIDFGVFFFPTPLVIWLQRSLEIQFPKAG